MLVEDHPLLRLALIGDEAEIGGPIALAGDDPGVAERGPLGGKESLARHQRLRERGDVGALLPRLFH